MREYLFALAAFVLSGCVGNSSRPVDLARHDLGDLVEFGGRWPAMDIPITRVDVRVAAWLDSPAQLYRLSYADPLRRHSYAENRWVAPPGELIERFLQRRIQAGQPDGVAPNCRLVLWLDELEQRFTGPQASEVVLDVRASLQPVRGEATRAKREIRLVKAAPTPDARGGVVATRTAAEALASELARWLADLAREQPRAITSCKEKSS